MQKKKIVHVAWRIRKIVLLIRMLSHLTELMLPECLKPFGMSQLFVRIVGTYGILSPLQKNFLGHITPINFPLAMSLIRSEKGLN